MKGAWSPWLTPGGGPRPDGVARGSPVTWVHEEGRGGSVSVPFPVPGSSHEGKADTARLTLPPPALHVFLGVRAPLLGARRPEEARTGAPRSPQRPRMSASGPAGPASVGQGLSPQGGLRGGDALGRDGGAGAPSGGSSRRLTGTAAVCGNGAPFLHNCAQCAREVVGTQPRRCALDPFWLKSRLRATPPSVQDSHSIGAASLAPPPMDEPRVWRPALSAPWQTLASQETDRSVCTWAGLGPRALPTDPLCPPHLPQAARGGRPAPAVASAARSFGLLSGYPRPRRAGRLGPSKSQALPPVLLPVRAPCPPPSWAGEHFCCSSMVGK